MPGSTLVWFHNDLRLADHPALTRAVDRNCPVVPVFIWAPDEAGDWPPGGAHRWWLHHSLDALTERLPEKPPNYERVIGINRGQESVEDEVEAIELELGPNRCAAEADAD